MFARETVTFTVAGDCAPSRTPVHRAISRMHLNELDINPLRDQVPLEGFAEEALERGPAARAVVERELVTWRRLVW